MQVHRKYKLLMTIPFVFLAQSGFAQSTPELDITIQVLRDSQPSQGIVNQLDLPPPEFFNPNSIISNAQENENTQNIETTETIEAIEDMEDMEGMESPGAQTSGAGDSDPVAASVNNLVEDTVPLTEPAQDQLQETLGNVAREPIEALNETQDRTTDTVTGIVDNLGDLPSDTADDVTASVSNVLDTTTDTVRSVTGTADDVLDNTSNTVVESTANVDDLADTVTDTASGIGDGADLVDGLNDQLAPTEELLDNTLDEGLLQETIDTTQEEIVPGGVLNDTVNDLTDSLPGI